MRIGTEAFDRLNEFVETVGDLLDAIDSQYTGTTVNNPWEAECARVVAAGEAWANAILAQQAACDCPTCRARRAKGAFFGKAKLN